MHRVGRRPFVGRIGPSIAAIALTAAIAALLAVPALAENPLYCSEVAALNEGCAGPHGLMHVNEARNESGGTIYIQFWVSGFGYSEPAFAVGGNVAKQTLTIERESFNKCWNGTNAKNTIHCRYELWKT
jgi:hypothetical protein